MRMRPTVRPQSKEEAQQVVDAVKGGVRRFGRVIKKGVNWLTQPSKDYKKAQKAKDDAYRQEGEDMMAGRERVKGRSSSDGSMR